MSEMDIHQANGQSAPLAAEERDVVLSVRDVTVAFGDNVVLDKLSLDVYRGEILGFVGASGTGKSVLLRTVLGLTPKRSGTVSIFGFDLDRLDDRERMVVDMRNLVREFRDEAHLGRGRVVVGASPSVAAAFLPKVIAEFQRRRPGIEVVLVDDFFGQETIYLL